MSLQKKYLKTKPVCKVKFVLEKERAKAHDSVSLIGSFNGWNQSDAIVMRKQRSGSFWAEVPLVPGKEYAFRYLVDGQTWENDSAADKYIPSNVCEDDNSVVVV